jgi:hypothetical protein
MKFKSVSSAAILTAVLCISGNVFAVLSGGGTQANPYLIQSRADFDEFANPSNAALYWASGKYTKLMCDLNLSGTTYTQAVIAPDTSTTTGFQGTIFKGIFDGNGHTISNLTIIAPNKHYIGLFGWVGSIGKIRNLGVENVNITGESYIGGLAGCNYANLISCHATGSVSGTFIYIGGLVGSNSGFIDSCYATGSVSGTGSPSDYVGGLVGYNEFSSIINCYATGSVSGTYSVGGLVGKNDSGTIASCYATGSVSGNAFVGGLVGVNSGGGSIMSCYATGSVVGGDYIGGLAGYNSGSLTACFWDIHTSGKSSGVGSGSSTGVTGKTTAEMMTLSTFTNAGWDFSTTDGDPADWRMPVNSYPRLAWETIGSLGSLSVSISPAGAVSAGAQWRRTGTTTWYNSGTPESGIPVGLYVVEFKSVTGWTSPANQNVSISNGAMTNATGSYTLQTGSLNVTISPQGAIDAGAQWRRTGTATWLSSGTVESEIPVGSYVVEFKSVTGWTSPANQNVSISNDATTNAGGTYMNLYSGGDGTAGNPYKIATVSDFQQLSDTPTDWSLSFILTANIDLTGLTFTQAPIAPDTDNEEWNGFQGTPFTGIFDGNGHTISNLTITASTQDCVGLFGNVGSDGQIRNLGVENVNITGRDYSGGLIGSNADWDSYSFGGTITTCYATGSVTGRLIVGGLVGDNWYGTLISCYTTSSVTGTDSLVGGLVGWNSGGWLTSCYVTGSVTGYSLVGGLVGLNENEGTLTDCFWDIQTSGQTTSDGGTGKTTAEMMTLSTFTDAGWDFTDTAGDPADWMMLRPDEDYPRLAWQPVIASDIAGLYGVNSVDYAEIAAHWGQTGCPIGCGNADINNDGTVDINDLISLANNWLDGI